MAQHQMTGTGNKAGYLNLGQITSKDMTTVRDDYADLTSANFKIVPTITTTTSSFGYTEGLDSATAYGIFTLGTINYIPSTGALTITAPTLAGNLKRTYAGGDSIWEYSVVNLAYNVLFVKTDE